MIAHAYSAIKRRRYARKAQAQQRKQTKATRRGRQLKTLVWLSQRRNLNEAEQVMFSRLMQKLEVFA